MSSSEFLEWCIVLEEEIHEREKTDFYLAQIACEIRRSYVKRPQKYKLDQFLIPFTRKSSRASEPVTKSDKESHIAKSKAFWLGGMSNLKVIKKQ